VLDYGIPINPEHLLASMSEGLQEYESLT
jgi:hypothetical protein